MGRIDFAKAGLDVIGDVHGRGRDLERLLRRLGYAETDGAWRHASRRAVFIGDLVDRGPEVLRVLEIARAMQREESAVVLMGNHEYNLLAYEQGRCNMTQQKIIEQQPSWQALEGRRHLLDWLFALPLWHEVDGARFVHAYWGATELRELGTRNALAECGWELPGFRGTPVGRAIERILKGPEVRLPEGIDYRNRHGYVQDEIRVAWWRERPATPKWREITAAGIDGYVPDDLARTYDPYPADAPPVFIGHYGQKSFEGLFAPNVACVDYGGADGLIGAYRWDGERALREDRFVR